MYVANYCVCPILIILSLNIVETSFGIPCVPVYGATPLCLSYPTVSCRIGLSIGIPSVTTYGAIDPYVSPILLYHEG